MKTSLTRLSILTLLAASMLCVGAAAAQYNADTIYTGGPIVTIDDAAPTGEAVAVKDCRILAMGALAEVETNRGTATETFDLGGRATIAIMCA
ncbi:hypothetical protein L1787_08345 [Acuticoccus sp. M5D2P5]|uniref:hypothetical protein n=1 Tax=Acuticoccus kalidii TaxID=2910977 RepID=UPI001F435B0C|nr:hypothetical protein [Acuticoccus kalidii]MCF3933417.1 hypothetical protein [Acuticoccus kalidii]